MNTMAKAKSVLGEVPFARGTSMLRSASILAQPESISVYMTPPTGLEDHAGLNGSFSDDSRSPTPKELKICVTDEGSWMGCFNCSCVPLLKQIFTLGLSIPMELEEVEEEGGLLTRFIGDMSNSQSTRNHMPRFVIFYIVFLLLNLLFSETLGYPDEMSIPMAILFALPLDALVVGRFQKQRMRGIQAKMEEWRPIFEAKGFVMTLREDEEQWRFLTRDVYVHIVKRQEPPPPPTLVGTINLNNNNNNNNGNTMEEQDDEEQQRQQEEKAIAEAQASGVNYLIYYARMFVRRNQGVRDILESEINIVKPPQLENLEDNMFQALVSDFYRTIKSDMKTRYIIHFATLIWVTILAMAFSNLWWETIVGSSALILPIVVAIVLIVWVDQYILLHILPSRIPILVEQRWRPRLNEVGFTITYNVDQPRWWNWKESYIHLSDMHGTVPVDGYENIVSLESRRGHLA